MLSGGFRLQEWQKRFLICESKVSKVQEMEMINAKTRHKVVSLSELHGSLLIILPGYDREVLSTQNRCELFKKAGGLFKELQASMINIEKYGASLFNSSILTFGG